MILFFIYSDTITCQPIEDLGVAQGNNALLTKTANVPLQIPESMDYENKDQHKAQQETEEISIDQVVTTPKKKKLQYPENVQKGKIVDIIPTTSKKKLRYPGDVLNNRTNMTPRTMAKSIRILKSACEKKTKTIKRLRTELHRQKKNIENISAVLTELQQKCLLSPDSCDVLQVDSFIFC